MTCFYVYEIQTILAESNISHGVQIPQLSGQSKASVQLELTISSNLMPNKLYSAIITSVSGDEEETNFIQGTTEFSKS